MPTYAYTARDRNGNPVQGVVISADIDTVRELLRERDLFLTSAVEQGGALPQESTGVRVRRGRRVRIGDMVVMSRQLATLVRAGLPLNECLYTTALQSENQYLRDVLHQVRRDVLGGSSLAEAVARHPNVFPELYVALIRAGEAGGVLDETLDIAAEQFDKEAELREKVRSAFIYPIIVICVAIFVVGFLILFVIPQFDKVYRAFNAQLPLVTLALLRFSAFAVSPLGFPLLLALTVGGYVAVRRYIRTPKGRERWDRFKINVWLFGPLNRKVAIARLTRTLSAMVRSGVPILQALAISSRVANNVIIMTAMNRVAEFVQQGSRLWMPMEQTGEFPPIVTRMIAAGEESGNLDEMLTELTRFYDRDIEYTVQKLTRLLEPALTVLIGGVVLFVLLALYMPIFNLTNVLRR
ncbi:MAG: type II secretion system F family protein [Chloroherpetonaceae bacterium]|nr:type II secretion system F family protein [Chthonomonadaceae bacterium]MDW8206402.1 type II secretion system F family protein [Chloroherpetonaceae bacterium]